MLLSLRIAQPLAILAAFALAAALTGCGIGTITTAPSSPVLLQGNVHGGMQLVAGASIQLYAAGTSGNGSQATSLLPAPVLTDSQSHFSIANAFTCPSANTQVYLVASGGNPGFTSNVNNPALVLMAALGSCSSLLANPNGAIQVNEVTTAAAVYALAPFMAAADHVGATATNTVGIANAFLDSHLLADPATGIAPTLASNLSTESGKLNALADAIVPCVNSTGIGNACSSLFAAATPTGGSAPVNTLNALLNIVRNPSQNVAAVFGLVGSTPPFATSLTQAPADWTMTLTVSGGGLVEPTGLAIDKQGNVWASNFGDKGPVGLAAFTPQGTPFPGSPFGTSLTTPQTESYGLALDRNGDVWVISADNLNGKGSVAKFQGASSPTPGALVGQFTDSTINFPESIATDPAGSGTVLIGNYYGGGATVLDLNGNSVRSLGSGAAPFLSSITSDNAGGAWVGDQGNENAYHLLADGTVQTIQNCCYGGQAIKLDLHGNVWTTNFYPYGLPPAYTFTEIAPNGSVLIQKQSGGGLYSPEGAAIDAAGNFWVANYNGSGGAIYGTITEIAGNDTSVPAGTPLTPSTGLGLDAQMSLAYTVAPDASGNLWVAVRNGNSLRMFFGLAAPTATPAAPLPQAP